MTIFPTINSDFIAIEFKHEHRILDGIQFKFSKGKRAYFSGIKNNMRMCEVVKTLQFNDDNCIYVSFGKQKIKVGTFTTK